MAHLTLGIETSCDETAAAVLKDGRRIRSSVIASQEALHAPFGGIVPDIVVEAPRPSVAKGQGGQVEKEKGGEAGKDRPEGRQERKISEEEGDPNLQIGKRDGPDPSTDVQLKRAMEILKASRILEKGVVKGNAG